jgi:hypothetical protein
MHIVPNMGTVLIPLNSRRSLYAGLITASLSPVKAKSDGEKPSTVTHSVSPSQGFTTTVLLGYVSVSVNHYICLRSLSLQNLRHVVMML